ncbi:hypothetical protein D3C72_803970 [compost metagenome]
MRASQVPLAIHWDMEPGRVEILLKQEVGTHLPWLELALALFVLVAIADSRLLIPAAGVAVAVVAVGHFYERRARNRRPALVRLDWEAQEAEVTYSDGNTAQRALKDPGYAHSVRLRGAMRTAFATGWERPDGTLLLVRHRNRSESTNFLRDLARAGWPVHRDEVDLS